MQSWSRESTESLPPIVCQTEICLLMYIIFQWQHEEEDANVFVLTEADKDRFQEILITSLYELGQR